MKTLATAVFLLGLIVTATAGSARAEQCHCQPCLLSCVNNFGKLSDITVPSAAEGKKCVAQTQGKSNDQLCHAKGFWGAGKHHNLRPDLPALSCDTPTCW